MGAYSDIYGALIAQLETLVGYSIAWENDSTFQPVEGTPYLAAYHLPAMSKGAACGPDAQNYFRGVFQVNVLAPSDKGAAQAYGIADTVISKFKRGTELVLNGTRVTCEKCEVSAGIWDNMWYVVPVSVTYFAYAANT